MPTKRKKKTEQSTPEMVLAPEVMQAVSQLRTRSEMLVAEIGRMELKKITAINEINAINQKASALLRVEGERLGVPAGTPWSVTPEGKVKIEGAAAAQ
jgi:hypothetical protein